MAEDPTNDRGAHSSRDPKLAELLLIWEGNWEEGFDIPPEELCGERADLVEPLRLLIRGLKDFEAVPGPLESVTPSGTDAGPSPRTDATSTAHYTDIRPHARGGLGVVYVARNREFQRPEALKFVRAEMAIDPESQDHFLGEAQITARLEHPGVVPIYGIGRDNRGERCYAMRFIRGVPMDRAIAEFHGAGAPGLPRAEADAKYRDLLGSIRAGRAAGPRGDDLRDRAFRELLGRFGSVCQTIAYAHSKRIVHRDLKPANVLLGKFGETLVIDWGLARPFTAASGGTAGTLPLFDAGEPDRSGPGVKGTPAYMSPEQAEGAALAPDPKMDVYGLGATLYGLLIGSAPFAGKGVDVLEAVRAGEVVPPRQRVRSIPRALEAICLKAMALRPADRYAGAADLAGDVENWLADRPVDALPDSPPMRLARWGRRHRPLVATAAAMIALTSIMSIAAVVVIDGHRRRAEALALLVARQKVVVEAERQRAVDQEATAKARAAEAIRERARAEAGEVATKRALYVTHLNLARRDWEAGRIQGARDHLARAIPAPGQPDQRGFEWYHLRRLAYGVDLETLKGHTASVRALAFTPDGRGLMTVGDDGDAIVWDVDAGQPRSRAHLAGSPVTGQDLWAGGSAEIDDSRRFAADANGRLVASTLEDGRPATWDVASGRRGPELEGAGRRVASLALSPDGRTLAVSFDLDAAEEPGRRGTSPGAVTLFDTETGRARRSIATANRATRVAFTPDGRALAANLVGGSLVLLDVETGAARASIFAAETGASPPVAFAPGGGTIYVGTDGDAGLVRAFDIGGRGDRAVEWVAHDGPVKALAASPDGRTLATAAVGGAVRLWEATTGRLLRALRGHRHEVRAIAFSPDGRRLATAGADQEAIVWDLAADPESIPLAPAPMFTNALAFAPDGATLATAGGPFRPTDAAPGELALWDPRDGHLRKVLQAGHPRAATAFAASPDGKTWAIGTGQQAGITAPHSAFGELSIWDAGASAPRLTLRTGSDAPEVLAFSPDGSTLAVAAGNPVSNAPSETLLVEPKAGRVVATLRGDPGLTSAIAFSPDGKTLATAAASQLPQVDRRGKIELWDPVGGIRRRVMETESSAILGLAYSPDGKSLAASVNSLPAFAGGGIELWDVATPEKVVKVEAGRRGPAGLAFSPDGKSLAVGTFDGTVLVYDMGSRDRPRDVVPVNFIPVRLSYTPDGRFLVAGGVGAGALGVGVDGRGGLRIWRSGPGLEPAAVQPGVGGMVFGLAPLATGSLFAWTDSVGEVATWDADNGRRVATPSPPAPPPVDGHRRAILATAFAPDGGTLATGGLDEQVKLWDVRTGSVLTTLAGHTSAVVDVAFAADGKVLATAAGSAQRYGNPRAAGEVKLWQIPGGRDAGTLRFDPPGVRQIAFLDGGRALAVATQTDLSIPRRGQVSVRALGEEGPRHTFADPLGTVLAMAVAPTGTPIASADFFGTVRLWDPATGRSRTVGARPAKVLSLAFSPDGRTLIGGCEDRSVRLWDVESAEEVLTLGGHTAPVRAVAFAPAGDALATAASLADVGSEPGEVRVWHSTRDRESVAFGDPAREGYFRHVLRRDANERVVARSYFGADGKPAAPFGWATTRSDYDSRGSLARQSWSGVDGRPATLATGWSALASDHDGRGRLARVAYLGPDDKPVDNRYGFATKAFVYGNDDTLIDTTFADATGRPVACRVLVSRVIPSGAGAGLGLGRGDAITGYGGEAVRSVAHLRSLIRDPRPGARPLTYARGGRSVTVEARPGPLGVEITDTATGWIAPATVDELREIP